MNVTSRSAARTTEKSLIFKHFKFSPALNLILLVLVAKLLVWIWGGIAHQVFTNRPLTKIGDWFALWNLWDAPRYLNIAEFGYQSTGEDKVNIAFYPLYPFLIRCVEVITHNYIASAFLVSAIASFAAAILLEKLVLLDYSPKIARATVWFLLIFPTSYFLHIGYTESLFLALSIGCLLAARTNRWHWAGLLGGLATMTRINGMVLIPALIVEVIQQYQSDRRFNSSWLWILVVPGGLLVYLSCNLLVYGNAFSFLEFQRDFWHKSSSFPWQGIWAKIQQTIRYSAYEMQMVGVQELLFIALGLAGTIWSWLNLRSLYTVWMLGNWWLFTSTSFILSVPRYTLVMFPLYIWFSLSYKKPAIHSLTIVWSLGFLILFSALFAAGRWAF